jgi:hypothetical protein
MQKDHVSSFDKATARQILGQNKGQLVVEYILLVVVVALAAVLISRSMVGRDPDNPGIIITKWTQLLQMVGADLGD